MTKAAVGQCCACNTQARFHNVFILNLFNCYIFLRAKAFRFTKRKFFLVFYLDLPMSSSDTDLNLSCCAICQRMRDFQTNGIFWLDFWYLYIDHLIRPEPGFLAFRAWFTAAHKSLMTIRTHVRCINFYTFHWISIHTHTTLRRWWSTVGNREER